RLRFCVFLVMLRDFPFFLVAAMDVKAVAKRHALAGGHLQIAGARGFLFKIMQAERIRGEQTVVAHVPPGGMTRVLRMIENGDADNLSIHRTVVIAPRGALAPGFAVP